MKLPDSLSLASLNAAILAFPLSANDETLLNENRGANLVPLSSSK